MAMVIRISEDMEKRLSALAKKTKRSKSFIVREAISNYLEDIEDYCSGMNVLKNPGRIHSTEETRKHLGLDD